MRGAFGPANLIMVYLLGVAIVAARLGHGPAILSSVLSVVAFDLFCVPPYFVFAVAKHQYLVTFTVMLTVRYAHQRARRPVAAPGPGGDRPRAAHRRPLYREQRISPAPERTEDILDILVRDVTEVLPGDVVVLLPDATGLLVVRAGNESAFTMNARERGVAQWVLDLGRAAGMGTDTIPSAECLYLPLAGDAGDRRRARHPSDTRRGAV